MKKFVSKKLAMALTIGLSLSYAECSVYAAEQAPSFDLDQIVITATRSEEKLKDVPASVSVITAEDMEKSGANNAADVLKKVTGLFVVDLYGNGNDTRIGLRGFQGVNANQNIQIQIDGIAVNDQGQGINTVLGNINLDNIEKIEIIKGPASALYGANSIGGVINIITKKGGPDGKTTITVQGGSFNGRDYAMTHAGQDKNICYSLAYRVQNGDGYRRHSDYDDKLFHARFDVDLGSKKDLEVLVDHSDRYFSLPGTLTQAEYDLDPRITSTPDDYRKVKEDRIAAIYNAQISPNLNLTNKIFYSNMKQQIRMDFDVPPRNEFIYHLNDSDGKTYGMETQINMKKKAGDTEHDITAGLLYKKEELTKDYFFEFLGVPGATKNNTLDRTTKALFMQDQIHVSLRATLSLGMRYDYFDFNYKDNKNSSNNYTSSTHAMSPKIALNYKISGRTSAYASIAKAFKPPGDPKLLYTDQLKPEEAWNYEIGIKSSPTNKMSYSLAIYRMNIDNLIVLDPVDLVSSKNAGKAHHQGVEFESEYQISSKWSAVFNYSYTQARYDKYSYEDDYGVFHVADGKTIEEVPKQMIVTGLCYDDHRKLQGNLYLRWVDKQYMDPMNKAQLPSYAVVDVGLKKKLQDNMTVSLNVYNLFDKKYAENAHYNSDLNEYGYLPASGRSIWAGLSYQF